MQFKKVFSILLGGIIMSSNCYAVELSPKINSKGAVLIEQDSKRILYGKMADVPLPMASTTKIMTCILAIETCDLNEMVTVSNRAARAPKVKLNLKVGEKQTLGDLLYSLMLESHNDTAVAVAEHVGGSVESFCQMMTQKAKEIGATHTEFQTPNGLDSEHHYAAPYDLAIITAYALSNPKFLEIITTTNITIPTHKVKGSLTHSLQNKNRFIYIYKGAQGVKTGFTSKAGHCFVGAAKRDDMQLIGVALGAGWGSRGKEQKYRDVITLMDYGFGHYKKYKVLDKTDNFTTIKVERGKKDTLKLGCAQEVVLPLSFNESQAIYLQKSLPSQIKAPIEKGMVVGRIDVICENKILKSVDLIAKDTIQKRNIIDAVKKLFSNKATK